MLSIVPTYRYKLNNKTTLGIGTGMSISSAKIPSESRKTGQINSQINDICLFVLYSLYIFRKLGKVYACSEI